MNSSVCRVTSGSLSIFLECNQLMAPKLEEEKNQSEPGNFRSCPAHAGWLSRTKAKKTMASFDKGSPMFTKIPTWCSPKGSLLDQRRWFLLFIFKIRSPDNDLHGSASVVSNARDDLAAVAHSWQPHGCPTSIAVDPKRKKRELTLLI